MQALINATLGTFDRAAFLGVDAPALVALFVAIATPSYCIDMKRGDKSPSKSSENLTGAA